MARRIVEGGYDLTLWARRPASLEPFADTAAKIAATPAELAAASDLVCLCVVGDDDVREVLRRRHRRAGRAGAGRDRRHPQHGAPRHVPRDRGIRCRAQGVSVIDAPVSGGAPAVEGHAAGHGRRRGGRRRALPSGLRDVRRRDRAPRSARQRPGRQDPEQSVVHRQPRQRGEHPGIGRRAWHSARPALRGAHPRVGHQQGVQQHRLRSAAASTSSRPSPVPCCRRTSGTPRASPTPRRRPRVRCSTPRTRRCRRWTTAMMSAAKTTAMQGRLRRRGANGRTDGASSRRRRSRRRRARPHRREAPRRRELGATPVDDLVDDGRRRRRRRRLRVHRRSGPAGLPRRRPAREPCHRARR